MQYSALLTLRREHYGERTLGIGSKAIEQLPAAIVEAQGIDGVEGVSGASVTSKAIFTAMADILEQAQA